MGVLTISPSFFMLVQVSIRRSINKDWVIVWSHLIKKNGSLVLQDWYSYVPFEQASYISLSSDVGHVKDCIYFWEGHVSWFRSILGWFGYNTRWSVHFYWQKHQISYWWERIFTICALHFVFRWLIHLIGGTWKFSGSVILSRNLNASFFLSLGLRTIRSRGHMPYIISCSDDWFFHCILEMMNKWSLESSRYQGVLSYTLRQLVSWKGEPVLCV